MSKQTRSHLFRSFSLASAALFAASLLSAAASAPTDVAPATAAASTPPLVEAARAAVSTDADVVSGSVSIAGSLNTEMGCDGDWAPGCPEAALTLRGDGIWSGTFDLPAGEYEYKVALDGSWDVSYGANGEPGGANIALTHAGGPVVFYFDPRSKIAQTDADGPIVSVAGSFQSEVGCAADWDPSCLSALLADADRDGVYEFATASIPAGAYEVKTVHGGSWAENYGAGGQRDGANIPFSTGDGEVVTFRYTLSTHVLDVEVANPPLPGFGQLQAQWIDESTVVVPADLGAGGTDTWTLHASPSGGVALQDGVVVGGESFALAPIDGGLTVEQRSRFPHLADYRAFHLDTDRATELLRGQLVVTQSVDGTTTAFTGVQIPGVLDDLYAAAVEDETFGVDYSGSAPTFQLWAPTAQSVTLLTWPDAGADPVEHETTRDPSTGSWTATADAEGDEYLWQIEVYVPSANAILTNLVTDPYSVALTTNSTRSIAVDLDDPTFQPDVWRNTVSPVIERPVDRAIWELHIRDFSITDESVPEAERGTYLAFARDSAGTRHLRDLAEAGINTVHLLPSFDIATIEEDRALQQTPDCDLASFGPASTEQQACVEQVADLDGFNWGYDPYHFSTPEGSYAVEPDGGARIAEFRTMVGSLHGLGVQVVLDQVFNHTAQSGQGEKSVFDRIVPGYYHRLNAVGSVETSTCCQNVATEHAVAQKLMVDSIVLWARDYKVDGFRFDLMGHHSTENMAEIRAALDAFTLEADGVDGSKIYLYGEGWDFGEVSGNARFEQAVQGQLSGTGIGTFNDRLRDAVHGGSPVDGATAQQQGFGTGLATDPNGLPINGTPEEAFAELAHQTDLVKLGLAGNLRDFTFVTADGSVKAGSDLDYRGSAAGYAAEPGEVINYVDAHDNETLFDLAMLKLPADTAMADRIRMNTLSLATVTLSQSPSFWHAGTELLRSKSLDRNSYNSGDWFNRIDWTGQSSTFGSGLPRAADNEDKWPIMAPLLADPANTPVASDIATAQAQALDLLRLREEVDLLRLGSAALIQEKVSFPGSGPDALPGTVTMLIDDTVGSDTDAELDGALIVFNASPDPIAQAIPELAGRQFALASAQSNGSDPIVKETTWDAETGTVAVPARSVAVLVEKPAAPPEKVATIVLAAPDRLVASSRTPLNVRGWVVALDGSAPVGTVTVTVGNTVVATQALTIAHRGRVHVALPPLSRGLYFVRTSFIGADGYADSRAFIPIPVLVF